MIHNGTRLKTTYSTGVTNGKRFRTSFGVISKGTRLKTSFGTGISQGSRFKSHFHSEVIKKLFVTNPAYASWEPGVYTYNNTLAGQDMPFLQPDITVKISLMANGTTVDLSPFLNTFNIDMPLGGKYTFSATFLQHSKTADLTTTDGGIPSGTNLFAYLATFPSDFNPFFYGAGSYNGMILHHRYDVSRQFLISITVRHLGQSQTWNAPPMCPEAPSFDGYLLKWSGGDMTTLFEQEYQTMKDITVKSTTTYKAWDTIRAIGTQYNFINFTFSFPDFQIRALNRQLGRPLDWIDKITKPYQAYRRWSGQQLEFITPLDPKDLQPLFLIKDFMITEGSYNLEMNTNWKNKFTISRLDDQGGIYGQAKCSGGKCIGRTLEIVFDEPLDNVELIMKLDGPSVLNDFVFFDVGGQPVLPYGDPIHRGLKVKSVKGTYMPTYNQVTTGFTGFGFSPIPYASEWGYEVYAKGGSSNTAFSSNYTYKLTDTSGTVDQWGLRPEHENIEDELIPTAAIAENYLRLVMMQNIRKVWKLDISTIFVNPFIRPADCLAIVDYLTGQDSHKWLVERINISMDDDGHCEQKLELYRGVM